MIKLTIAEDVYLGAKLKQAKEIGKIIIPIASKLSIVRLAFIDLLLCFVSSPIKFLKCRGCGKLRYQRISTNLACDSAVVRNSLGESAKRVLHALVCERLIELHQRRRPGRAVPLQTLVDLARVVDALRQGPAPNPTLHV